MKLSFSFFQDLEVETKAMSFQTQKFKNLIPSTNTLSQRTASIYRHHTNTLQSTSSARTPITLCAHASSDLRTKKPRFHGTENEVTRAKSKRPFPDQWLWTHSDLLWKIFPYLLYLEWRSTLLFHHRARRNCLISIFLGKEKRKVT